MENTQETQQQPPELAAVPLVGSVEMTKEEQLAAFRASNPTGGLIAVDGVQPLDLYVKQWSSKEFQRLGKRIQAYRDKYDDGLNEERELACQLFDANGNLYFDPNHLPDLQFLADLPAAVRHLLDEATRNAVWGDVLQKKILKNLAGMTS